MAMVIATIGKAGFVFIGGNFTTTVSFHKGIYAGFPWDCVVRVLPDR